MTVTMNPRSKAVRSLIAAAKLEYFLRHHARPDADYIAIWFGPAAGRWLREADGNWRLL